MCIRTDTKECNQYNSMGANSAGIPVEVKGRILCVHNRDQLYNLPGWFLLSGECNRADGV